MTITPEHAARLLAVVSRELHLMDVPHEQRSLVVSVSGVPHECMPERHYKGDNGSAFAYVYPETNGHLEVRTNKMREEA